ncbi:MAG: hypothetical protein HYT76_03115 [Deltaproteobacteria bacterium]|nr:hypothetical protein [Deltaproteobacteria bacterium]
MALASLQLGMLIVCFHHATLSVPALLQMSRKGSALALSQLAVNMTKGGLQSRRAAGRALEQIALDNPVLFTKIAQSPQYTSFIAAPHQVRTYLDKILALPDHQTAARATLVGDAIVVGPSNFLPSDMEAVLRALRTSKDGPDRLESLIFRAPHLAPSLIAAVPKALKSEEIMTVKWGTQFRAIWGERLSEADRGRFLLDWERKLLDGSRNTGLRPTRDFHRLLCPERYKALVEDLAEREHDWDLAATPLLEDLMVCFGRFHATHIKMENAGRIVSFRRDVDISAFDFLWDESFVAESPLRLRTLHLLEEVAGASQLSPDGSLWVKIDGVQRKFGSEGLFKGWFNDPELLVSRNLPCLMTALRSRHHSNKEILKAIARLHRIDPDRVMPS